MTALNTMPQVKLEVSAEQTVVTVTGVIIIRLHNPSEHIAFFERASICSTRDGNEILPIEYDDNYVTVFPGETVEIHGTVSIKEPILIGSSSKDTTLPRFQPKLSRNAAGRFCPSKGVARFQLMMTAKSKVTAQRGVGMGTNLPEQSRSRLSAPVDARATSGAGVQYQQRNCLGIESCVCVTGRWPDSIELGSLMAEELVQIIEENNRHERPTRAIIPCGPTCWYDPFRSLVNARGVSLKALHVFHMDECLDWEGPAAPDETSHTTSRPSWSAISTEEFARNSQFQTS